ncbi:MAG: ATP-binding cassette domain-containing protein [Candidatus Thorarchaeota archaeon]
MDIRIRRARENNLKDVSVDIGDGLTVVTGISGSGKTSLVFDTMYHEARRRFLEVFNAGRSTVRLAPANVDSITGIGPTVAVGQNLLNRNPLSTLASASGIHPFLRLLYTRFGTRFCAQCGASLSRMTEDEIVERIQKLAKKEGIILTAPLMRRVVGGHSTLLSLLDKEFGAESLLVDGKPWKRQALAPSLEHDVSVIIGRYTGKATRKQIRESVEIASALGANSVAIRSKAGEIGLSRTGECSECGKWIEELEPKHFRMKCTECGGEGCEVCHYTGMHSEAAMVKWEGHGFGELMALTVDEARKVFRNAVLPSTANRLKLEIVKRLDALLRVGLGYIQLNRPAPSLSRGESQRVRLAISLTNKLEDVVHLLDEPTIGQSAADIKRLLPAFRELPGPVIYVEHDRLAAAEADRAIDIGPAAGENGGEIIFTGTPAELWEANTTSGRYFSLHESVPIRRERTPPSRFLTIRNATKHNLKGIDVRIPLERLTVISGVSGSGKSTLVEHVLVPSLEQKEPVGCAEIDGEKLKPVLVDQKPVGRNPRSNPATYTKLSDIVRDLYASESELSASHFSFNRPEGRCPACKGMGAVEVKMRYLPSIWITCSACEGKRFNPEVLETKVNFGSKVLTIAGFYQLSIREVQQLLAQDERLPLNKRRSAKRILGALVTIGLGYLKLGQPSPQLSGGESQRVKLAKFLGKRGLSENLLILDEPSTGLSAADLHGLLSVLGTLVEAGATIVVVEHNLDIVRSADWIIDLGIGAGPDGGELLFEGAPEELGKVKTSLTAKALRDERKLTPRETPEKSSHVSDYIRVKKASANNLKDVSLDIPKGKLTVVTGPSGSGKSSLVRDVLQAEAERRYYESLSLYERQGIKEGPGAPVESVNGLGVTISITSRRRRGAGWWSVYAVRTTVGIVTEVSNHLAALFATIGKVPCEKCGKTMKRGETLECPACGTQVPLLRPKDFSSRTYTSACVTCSGVGHRQVPIPEKLIIHSDKPICAGAMYSPGYFPRGYFCTPTSWAGGALDALGERYGFDPKRTPWNEIPEHVQNVFLYGDPNPEPLDITYMGTRRGKRLEVKSKGHWSGFYRWVSDWDVGGTYTRREHCEECDGSGLRQKYRTIKLRGHSINELNGVPISELKRILGVIKLTKKGEIARSSLEKIIKRLGFLEKVGLGYLHLNREANTLSAGESQRVILSSLLGSGLTSLTVLLDEPTRGMHPSEVDALVDALQELRDEGHSVIVVEHDLGVIKAADILVDMGPKSGESGGKVVASGTLPELMKMDTITARWLRGDRAPSIADGTRKPIAWMKIKGAKANNLKNLTIEFPLGLLIGICGTSGSGKSTLMVDTIGRALAPTKFTTSVSYVPLEPGEHESITGSPERVVMLDQGRKGIRSPGYALDLFKPLVQIYAESEDAEALGLDYKSLSTPCTVCEGQGRIRTVMGFLPDVFAPCETCKGTGRSPEAWDVRVKGISLPELNDMTLGQLYKLFNDDDRVSRKLETALEVGLDYLVLRQPSVTLSGGEIQRLKIAQELSKKNSSSALYIIDEPTVGQHLEDVDRLIGVLQRLVSEGNTVIVVEHHPNVLAACDWLLELGPVGGPKGGRVIATGTPKEVAGMDTPTAPYLREVLEGAS